MASILSFLGWALVACIKFLFTPGSMIAAGYGYWETIINTFVGAAFGILLFFFTGKSIFAYFDKTFKRKKSKPKKAFTKKNKVIVIIKSKFGLIGIASLMGIISVPLSTLLAARFFSGRIRVIGMLMASAAVWTFLLTTAAFALRYWIK